MGLLKKIPWSKSGDIRGEANRLLTKTDFQRESGNRELEEGLGRTLYVCCGIQCRKVNISCSLFTFSFCFFLMTYNTGDYIQRK